MMPFTQSANETSFSVMARAGAAASSVMVSEEEVVMSDKELAFEKGTEIG
jgi:hypothetical protein